MDRRGVLLPVLNYALMFMLATSPTRVRALEPPDLVYEHARRSSRRSTIAGVLAGALAALLAVITGVQFIKSYGLTIFLGTPFVVGLVSGFVANRIYPRGPGDTILVAMLALLLTSLGLLMFATEGLVCIAMALPIATPLALLGGLVGQTLAARRRTTTSGMALLVALLPAGSLLDRVFEVPAARVVTTVVDVDAPPAIVWRHVVSFGRITEAPQWYFRTGLAYPLQARIEGTGACRQILRVLNRRFPRADHRVGRACASGVRRGRPASAAAGMESVVRGLRAAPSVL